MPTNKQMLTFPYYIVDYVYTLIPTAMLPNASSVRRSAKSLPLFMLEPPLGCVEDVLESFGTTFFLKYLLSSPTTFPAGVYSHTTYQPCALGLLSSDLEFKSFSSSPLYRPLSSVYPQLIAAHPTSVVDFHTSCVK